MQELLEQLTFVAKVRVKDDVECARLSPNSIHLDPYTEAALSKLFQLKGLILADELLKITSEMFQQRKEVERTNENVCCVLIALVGGAVQIVSAYIIGKRTGKKAAEEAFKIWADGRI